MRFEHVRLVLTFPSRVPDMCLTIIWFAFIQIKLGSSGHSSHSRGTHVGYDLSHFIIQGYLILVFFFFFLITRVSGPAYAHLD